MITSIVSVLTGITVRKDTAMTGEVTLRGGIKTVMIPAENEKDLTEIPDNVKQGLTIIPVSNVREVLKHALVRAPEPVEWDEAAEEAAAAARLVKAETPATPVAH